MATEVFGALRQFPNKFLRDMYPSSVTVLGAALATRFPRATVFGVRDGQLFPARWAQLATKAWLSGGIRAWKLASRRAPGELESTVELRTGATISRPWLVVHNETSTGVTSRTPSFLADGIVSATPALLIVDAISSLDQ